MGRASEIETRSHQLSWVFSDQQVLQGRLLPTGPFSGLVQVIEGSDQLRYRIQNGYRRFPRGQRTGYVEVDHILSESGHSIICVEQPPDEHVECLGFVFQHLNGWSDR